MKKTIIIIRLSEISSNELKKEVYSLLRKNMHIIGHGLNVNIVTTTEKNSMKMGKDIHAFFGMNHDVGRFDLPKDGIILGSIVCSEGWKEVIYRNMGSYDYLIIIYKDLKIPEKINLKKYSLEYILKPETLSF